jgi:hypothetical protein
LAPVRGASSVQQRYSPMSRRPSGQAARDDASSGQLNRCVPSVTMKLLAIDSRPRSAMGERLRFLLCELRDDAKRMERIAVAARALCRIKLP